jgi:hypothetical protein
MMWDQLGVQGWAPHLEPHAQDWAGIHEQREALFAYPTAIEQSLGRSIRKGCPQGR